MWDKRYSTKNVACGIALQVHIQLGAIQQQQNDDEDFEGSGLDGYPSPARQVTIPIQCHSEPNFPIGFGDKMDDDNVMVRTCLNGANGWHDLRDVFLIRFLQDTVDLPVGQMDLYHMEIHRNKEWTVPVVTGAGNEASKAEVVFDETLHVRTWIDGGNCRFVLTFVARDHSKLFCGSGSVSVSYIQIVTEKCWVSNSSDSEQPFRLLLIRNTCPADLSVEVRQTNRGDSDGGFSFHVSHPALVKFEVVRLSSSVPSVYTGFQRLCAYGPALRPLQTGPLYQPAQQSPGQP